MTPQGQGESTNPALLKTPASYVRAPVASYLPGWLDKLKFTSIPIFGRTRIEIALASSKPQGIYLVPAYAPFQYLCLRFHELLRVSYRLNIGGTAKTQASDGLSWSWWFRLLKKSWPCEPSRAKIRVISRSGDRGCSPPLSQAIQELMAELPRNYEDIWSV